MKKRVKIPTRNAKGLLDLVKKVREKHLADGDASPLKVLNWAEIGPEIDAAIELEERALKLKREKLSVFQQRAHRLEVMTSLVRRSRDVLVGVHLDEMKTLGLWGFDVLEKRATDSDPEETTTEKA